MKIVPLIPSLSPDEKLIDYVNALIKIGFEKIIIVNDGSTEKYDKFFEKLESKKECIVLKHAVNQGKGRALKTGFNYYLNNLEKDYEGIVTADSDGQHCAEDTWKVAEMVEKKNKFILGVRDFNDKKVPFRSRFGNKITNSIFTLLYKRNIEDTQTGLRGIPNLFVKKCLSFSGERFEYEINMLMQAMEEKQALELCGIKTIYIENNKSSHFNPIKDSMRIYGVLLKEFSHYLVSMLLVLGVDLLLFYTTIATLLGNEVNRLFSILLATFIARFVTSTLQYGLNKNVVFKKDIQHNVINYYLICIGQMFLSAGLLELLSTSNIINILIWKAVIDIILMIICYFPQKHHVFREK